VVGAVEEAWATACGAQARWDIGETIKKPSLEFSRWEIPMQAITVELKTINGRLGAAHNRFGIDILGRMEEEVVSLRLVGNNFFSHGVLKIRVEISRY